METELKEAQVIGNTHAALEAGQRIGALEAPRSFVAHGVPFIVTPKWLEIKEREDLMERPLRISTSRTMYEADSFSEYVKTFSGEGTRLFGSIDSAGSAAITAILDDHIAPATPSHGAHTARLVLESHPEWRRWMQRNREILSQREFAEFVEENIRNIVTPAAADLLTALKSFSVKKNSIVDSVIDGGNIRCTVSREVSGNVTKSDIELPREFVLGLRPFKRGSVYEVRAILRFRETGDGFGFEFVLVEPEVVLESAFNDARAEVEEATGLKVHV